MPWGKCGLRNLIGVRNEKSVGPGGVEELLDLLL